MVESRPSRRNTLARGLARRASKTIRIFFFVVSDTTLWLPEDRRAEPDWKKDDNTPPIVTGVTHSV